MPRAFLPRDTLAQGRPISTSLPSYTSSASLPPKPLPSFKRNSAASTGKAPQVHNGIVPPNERYHPYQRDPRRTHRLTQGNLVQAKPPQASSQGITAERRQQERKVSLWLEGIPRDALTPSIPLQPPHPYATFSAIDVLNFALSKSYHPRGIHENPKGTLPENIALTVYATIQRYKVLQQPHIAAKFTEEQLKCRDRILRHLSVINERIRAGHDFTFVDKCIAIKLCVGLGKIPFKGINKEQERVGKEIVNFMPRYVIGFIYENYIVDFYRPAQGQLTVICTAYFIYQPLVTNWQQVLYHYMVQVHAYTTYSAPFRLIPDFEEERKYWHYRAESLREGLEEEGLIEEDPEPF
ncbi:uncharacterized protein LAESUDRAFT_758370 [Laetiporus sulphureus 93-53]|uniref:Uncharacterized protein n=1 Tax=Laetiporus sulphureus 93-53 TaxID=1314785 RepID=A0A165EUX8_9APHY|nr:uncharacterized protein LAESUDRAFT_758370 [Laetiporus sulphureus 93-53]KZT07813.1 hypothetical protein LAESUDRAFT_758370 [Laetiporus sulphureus 93-53]